MKIKVMSKDVDAKKMVLGRELFKNIPLHIYELICEKCIYELEDHVGEEALSLNLSPKLELIRKILLASFPNHLLKNV
jgi:hypothetical protein